MKQKIVKKYLNNLSIINQMLFSFFIIILINKKISYADIIEHNINAPIKIYSDYQNINMQTSTSLITGNVFIQQEFIHIYANKVIIVNLNKKNSKKNIQAYGNPVIFYQAKNKHNPILATSLHISYNIPEQIITLIGKAYLKKEKNTIQSHCITYMMKKKYIETCNNKYHKHKTILNIHLQ